MRFSVIVLLCGLICFSCSNNELKSGITDKQTSFKHLQLYVDSGAYYYLKAIEAIEEGEDIKTVENRYVKKITFFHKKFSVTFDSFTNEYMNKKLNQKEYDEIRNSIFLDSVMRRSERLSQLGLSINLE